MRLDVFFAVRWRAVFKYLSCHFDIEPGPDGPFFDAAGMVPIMAPERKQRDRHIEKNRLLSAQKIRQGKKRRNPRFDCIHASEKTKNFTQGWSE